MIAKKCRKIAAFLFKKPTNLSESKCILSIKNAYIEMAKELSMLGVQTRDFCYFLIPANTPLNTTKPMPAIAIIGNDSSSHNTPYKVDSTTAK